MVRIEMVEDVKKYGGAASDYGSFKSIDLRVECQGNSIEEN